MTKVEARQDLIMKYCVKHDTIKISELLKIVPVSSATVRRDLLALEKKGLIRRYRNRVEIEKKTLSFVVRQRQNIEAKETIAGIAESLIKPGDSLIIDSGTTTYALAKLLTSRKDITVITNSIPVASLLSETQVRTFVCGGFIQDTALVDDDAIRYFANRKVDKAFIGTTGIHKGGITAVSPFQCNIKRAIINSANEVYVLMDSSKFNVAGVNLVVPFSNITGIITEEPVTNKVLLEQLKINDVKILCCF